MTPTAPVDEAHQISLALRRRIADWHAACRDDVDRFDIDPNPPDDFDPNTPVEVVPNPLRKKWRLR